VISKQDVLAVMSSVPEASIFALLDAVSRKQTQEALGLLTQQLAVGVHPLIIVNLLARQVRMLWRIKDMVVAGSGAQAIANQLKLHPFVAEKVAKQSRSFSVGTLKQAMLALADADRDFKSGQANSVVFDTLVINMCR
jgi:DNA polymerase III subunit delta